MADESKVYDFVAAHQGRGAGPGGPPRVPVDRSGGGGDNGGMEARVAKLEGFAQDTRDRLARIETRMDTFATKEDLQRELLAQTWRVIGAMLTFGTLLTGIVYYIARNVH